MYVFWLQIILVPKVKEDSYTHSKIWWTGDVRGPIMHSHVQTILGLAVDIFHKLYIVKVEPSTEKEKVLDY